MYYCFIPLTILVVSTIIFQNSIVRGLQIWILDIITVTHQINLLQCKIFDILMRRPTNAKIAYIAITSSCCSAYLHIIVVHFFFQFNFFKVQIRILPTYMLKCSYCYWSTSAVKHHHNKDSAFLNYLNLPHLLNMKFMSNN